MNGTSFRYVMGDQEREWDCTLCGPSGGPRASWGAVLVVRLTSVRTMAWVSVLALAWLAALRAVPFDALTVGVWLLFATMGVVASAADSSAARLESGRKAPKKK